MRWGQASVRFFNTSEFIHLLKKVLHVIFNLLYLPRVSALTICFQQGNLPLTQTSDGLVVILLLILWLSADQH